MIGCPTDPLQILMLEKIKRVQLWDLLFGNVGLGIDIYFGKGDMRELAKKIGYKVIK
jgi:hypothetical protein